jgi:murein DD-endopeptidase MepM/ murein hydrolase activator NlpD
LRTALLAALALLAATAGSVPRTAPATGSIPIPPPSYYRPLVVDGMTFPVARANWLSVVRFADDWHEPRMRLIDGTWRLVGFHEGVDIGAEKGTPILSVTAGRVEAVGWTFYSGTRVGVRGIDGRYYFYAHLSAVAPAIAVGAPVSAGTVLGRVGNTGYGSPGHEDEFPPHLHFGIQGGSDWVNPFPLVARLYREAVAATRRAERQLERLAAQGRAKAHQRLVARIFTDLG